MAENSDWADGPDIKPPKEGWYVTKDGDVKIDEAAAFKPVQKIPQGMSGFDKPLPPLNTPNLSAKDLQKGVKQFDFASKGDVEDTSTVLSKNRGIQLRTGSGNPQDKFNQQYNPEDPNEFGYKERFLFMKDPVNHWTEAPGFVTETDGMVYEKNYLANGPIRDFAIDPKKAVPTKDTSSATTKDTIDDEGDPTRVTGTETPKDLDSMGDDQKQAIKNFQNMIDNQDSNWFPKFDPSIMNKDVSDPALRGIKPDPTRSGGKLDSGLKKYEGRIEPMKPKKK